jgi:hypothetical protein
MSNASDELNEQSRFACCTEFGELIEKFLLRQASEQECKDLVEHIFHCNLCQRHFESIESFLGMARPEVKT